ncbi:hypothetical protein [Bradyrhizobium sp. ARR65]|uniref:hypothetical protein n=1 Tax=Bradyrhizobium sp. ARR65 TaxID=1040989 RepID=UPI0012F87262|nr:hypothetical protein [Bradyrhizobium sp. ARR65]
MDNDGLTPCIEGDITELGHAANAGRGVMVASYPQNPADICAANLRRGDAPRGWGVRVYSGLS